MGPNAHLSFDDASFLSRAVMDPVSSLYVHVPFCPQKCAYCAFVTHVGSMNLIEPYLDALLGEAGRIAARHENAPLDTVYLGGGTPSLLDVAQLSRLLDGLVRIFTLDVACEITMEAHPATVDRTSLRGYRQAGVNRISFGAESMDDAELRAVSRLHTPEDVAAAVRNARLAGIESVNLDLIYGLPGQSTDSWRRTVERAIALDPDHLSLYPLSVEPATVFARAQREGRLTVPDDDAVVEMYSAACALLRAEGYEHYEIASWARSGHRCRHNLAYWTKRQYFALGVGAHGYVHPIRTENIRGVRRYIDRLRAGLSPVLEAIVVDADIEWRETAMLGLRLLREGLDLGELRKRFGVDIDAERAGEIDAMVRAGMLARQGGRLLLAEEAVPVANEIVGRLVM